MSRKALFTEFIAPLVETAREAGAVIMSHYGRGNPVDRKEDASPVTEADRAADRLIVARLASLSPDIPVVSEEGEQPDVTGAEAFWLVDPLDGTKSFVRGSGYFTVNIGLIEHGAPVLGIIYDPVNERMYWGDAQGAFSTRYDGGPQPVAVRPIPSDGPVALVSHSHLNRATEGYLLQAGITERIQCASSIKFCWVAEGRADIYPRFGPTMEWDTAAGHAILAAAGGRVLTPDGLPFRYGKKGFLNGDFVASS